MWLLPLIVGVTTAKKLVLKFLLFLFPALSQIFKLCSWYHHSYHKTNFHHHQHHINHLHTVSFIWYFFEEFLSGFIFKIAKKEVCHVKNVSKNIEIEFRIWLFCLIRFKSKNWTVNFTFSFHLSLIDDCYRLFHNGLKMITMIIMTIMIMDITITHTRVDQNLFIQIHQKDIHLSTYMAVQFINIINLIMSFQDQD